MSSIPIVNLVLLDGYLRNEILSATKYPYIFCFSFGSVQAKSHVFCEEAPGLLPDRNALHSISSMNLFCPVHIHALLSQKGINLPSALYYSFLLSIKLPNVGVIIDISK